MVHKMRWMHSHGTFSSTLEQDKAWLQADLGSIFEVDSVFISSPGAIIPFTLIFHNTITNSIFSWSLDPTKSYTFYPGIAGLCRPGVHRGLQGLGSLKLSMFEINVYPAAPVPEPATILLFGIGISGVVLTRIRREKK